MSLCSCTYVGPRPLRSGFAHISCVVCGNLSSCRRSKRLLEIGFRGSVTVQDWAIDARLTLKEIPNPLANDSSVSISQRKTIGMHTGFYNYLFESNKYDQIISDLHSLLQKYPGFTIGVTGHSLGGALATLCTLKLALEKNIPKPIICVSFASPKAGNIRFARAFQELELQRKIICLRVTNHGDVIAQLPDRLTFCTFCFQDAIFRHVGIELRLYDPSSCHHDRTHRFFFPRIRRSRTRQLLQDLRRSFWHSVSYLFRFIFCWCLGGGYVKRHGLELYMDRFYQSQDQLQHIPISDIFTSYHKDVSEPSAAFFSSTVEDETATGQ